MMEWRWDRLGVLALIGALAACDGLTGGGACDGPFVQTVEPERVSLVGVTGDSVMLADIYFAQDTTRERPSADQLNRVRAYGSIVRVFQVQAVRVELSPPGIQSLWDDPDAGVVAVLSVPDPDLFTVSVFVGHDEGVSINDYFEKLGGIVKYDYSAVPIIAGWIDDTAIPCLRSYRYVDYVEHTHGRISLQ